MALFVTTYRKPPVGTTPFNYDLVVTRPTTLDPIVNEVQFNNKSATFFYAARRSDTNQDIWDSGIPVANYEEDIVLTITHNLPNNDPEVETVTIAKGGGSGLVRPAASQQLNLKFRRSARISLLFRFLYFLPWKILR